MTFTKCNLKSIFTLVFLTYYVSAEHGEIETCKKDITRYFNGLNNYVSCAMKSLMFYNHADFEDDYGYLYFLTFKNYLRRGSILKPTKYCNTFFAESDESLKNKMNNNNLMQFENDKHKTNFISNLVEEIIENNKTSSEDEFEEPLETEELSQSITYKYKLEDNDDIINCKNELSNNGFPDRITKTVITHIFFWKKYTDCKDCKFVKGYMNHIALNININSVMENPEQFCSNLEKKDTSLLDLLYKQLHAISPEPSTSEILHDHEIEKMCNDELYTTFEGLTNYKEIGDYVLFNIAVDELLDGSFSKNYIEILFAFIRPGHTKSIKSFCQEYSNTSVTSKIKLCFGTDENIQDTQTCTRAIRSYKFPFTSDKKEIISHALYKINKTAHNNNNNVHLKAYMNHIKMNYHIRSTMESPAKFCSISAKNITSRTHYAEQFLITT